ncbi:kinase-like domain-containing protein [Amanita rubescens]|nr:kinase-like domain-containing protein [Amanita rubescens]KAF8336718.1 kinase-like domain-containing protein [Amanita rubescens]
MFRRQYRPCRFDSVENLELYAPEGLHPVSIGDVFADGRYKVLHKLGYGGSSTIWLARDSVSGILVALKVLPAYKSTKPKDEIEELVISQKLDALIASTHHAARHNIQTIKDSFIEEGPNGTHVCLVSELAGPSVRVMSFPGGGRLEGSTRLRGDLAREVAKQTATVMELMHSAGLVHGDLTSSNVLFRVSDEVHKWSDDEIYSKFGQPRTDEVVTVNQSAPGPHAPREVVQAIDMTHLSVPVLLLEESIIVIDFGQSFDTKQPPTDYNPATAILYCPPETLFDNKFSFASDIWVLACTIFEIRAGYSLITSFLADEETVMQDFVTLFGKLPDPWWNAFKERHIWFHEDGQPKSPDYKSSIREKLQGIGERDEPPIDEEGPMIEIVGTQLEEDEVELLSDLLEKMFKYNPEERITIQEVVRHPWFEYTPGR